MYLHVTMIHFKLSSEHKKMSNRKNVKIISNYICRTSYISTVELEDHI